MDAEFAVRNRGCLSRADSDRKDVTVGIDGQFHGSTDGPVAVKRDNFLVAKDGVLLHGRRLYRTLPKSY